MDKEVEPKEAEAILRYFHENRIPFDTETLPNGDTGFVIPRTVVVVRKGRPRENGVDSWLQTQLLRFESGDAASGR